MLSLQNISDELIQAIIEDNLQYGVVNRNGLYGATDKTYSKASGGYDQLYSLCKYFSQALLNTNEGVMLEFGTHTGTSLMLYLSTLKHMDKIIPIQTVDPWVVPSEQSFRNTYLIMLNNIKPYLEHFNYAPDDLWMHYGTTDTIYMENIYPTLPSEYQKFRFAFLDGPHTFDPVRVEFDWIQDKIVHNGIVVIDDFDINSEIYKYIEDKYKNFEPSSFSNAIVFTKKG